MRLLSPSHLTDTWFLSLERLETVLVLDNASWHKHSSLNWHHIAPRYLPAYSPDFNPIEAIWRVLKDRFFNQWIAKSSEQLIERLCEALRSLLTDEVASIASVAYLLD